MSFEVVKGVHVPRAATLKQEFEILQMKSGQSHVVFNVSAEHIHDVFSAFLEKIPEPGFLIIEAPCNEVRELELRTTESDPVHKDVYYRDGLTRDGFSKVFTEFSDIFINDGMTNFGFGSHNNREEIFVGKYKTFHLYSDSLQGYLPLFEANRISKSEKIITAWDTFTKESPGVTTRWQREDGTDIYEVIEQLMRSDGLYLGKTVPG